MSKVSSVSVRCIKGLALFGLPCFVLLAGFGVSPEAGADIILQVRDDGPSLRFTWSGTMDVTGSTGVAASLDIDSINEDTNAIISLDGSVFRASGAGTTSANDPWILPTSARAPSVGSGSRFGFSSQSLLWDDSFGAMPGTISPTGTWSYTGFDVATAFGTNLDMGPVLLWTHNGTGDTISIAHVPEPSAFLLLGLVGSVAWIRRRYLSGFGDVKVS